MVIYSLKTLVKKFFDKELYKYQQQFLHGCLNNKRVVGVLCRQSGKSMVIGMLAGLEGLRHPNGNIVIVAPTDRQAGELFLKIQNDFQNSALSTYVKSQTMRTIILTNGCRIAAYPVGDSGAGIRGLTANVLIEEEAPLIKNSIHAQVLMPMVAATNGKVIKIGTPFGMNHFYNSAKDKDSNYKSYIYDYKFPLAEKHFTEDFIEEQRTNCTNVEFRTEYGAEFIADEDAYFPTELIENCINDVESIKQPREGATYYLGADLARLGRDRSVLIIIEKGTDIMPNKVVNIMELQQNKLDQTIEMIYELHERWSFEKIYVDETGLGAGVSDVLSRKINDTTRNKSVSQYRKTYDNADVVVGINFSMKSKMDIFSNLKMMMEQGRLVFPKHSKLLFQLKDFRYEIAKGTNNLKLHHSEGGHDDYCDALALAVRGVNTSGVVFNFG